MAPLYGYDSADPRRIPKSAKVLFPYADGRFAWHPKDFGFPKSVHVRYITVEGGSAAANRASIIDIEPGCVYPPGSAAVRDFVRARWEKHNDATVYCFRAELTAVTSALAGLKYKLFLSTLDGSKPRVFDGLHCSAVQFQGGPTSPYDRSIIYDTRWAQHEHEPADWWK